MNIDDWVKNRHSGIIIFGSGQRGKRVQEYAAKMDINIKAFCDNDPQKWGELIGGIKVISVAELDQYGRDCIIVIANKAGALDIYAQLENMGFHNLLFDYSLGFCKNLDFELEPKDKESECPELRGAKNILVVVDDVGYDKRQFARCVASVRHSAKGLSCEAVRLTEIQEGQYAEAVILISAGSVFEGESLKRLYETWSEHQEKIVCSRILSRELRLENSGYTVERRSGAFICESMGERFDAPEVNYVKRRDMGIPDGMIMSGYWWQLLRKELGGSGGSCLDALSNIVQGGERIEFLYQPQSIVVSRNKYPSKLEYEMIGLEQQNRDIVLVFDTTIARFNQNAGHRATKEYIDILLEMNAQIIYIVDNFRYDEKYTSYFQQKGIMAVYGCEWECNFEKKLKKYICNVIYAFINRPQVAQRYVGLLRTLNPNIYIAHFGHDIHFLRLTREAQVTGDKNLLCEADKYREMELGLLDKVDVSGYPSKYEVEYLRNYAPHACIEYFPLYFFENKTITCRSTESEGLLFVGSFGHPPNVDAVRWLITGIMPEVWARLDNVPVYIIGANPPAELQMEENENVRFCGFVEEDELSKYYERCKMAIAPLRYGAGMKGKVLEAMYYGTPTLTTPIGAEGIEGNTGIMVADGAREFAECIIKHYNDMEQLNKLSQIEQTYILENFSKKQLKDIIHRQIAMAIEKHRRG